MLRLCLAYKPRLQFRVKVKYRGQISAMVIFWEADVWGLGYWTSRGQLTHGQVIGRY